MLSYQMGMTISGAAEAEEALGTLSEGFHTVGHVPDQDRTTSADVSVNPHLARHGARNGGLSTVSDDLVTLNGEVESGSESLYHVHTMIVP